MSEGLDDDDATYFHSGDFETLILVDAVVAGIDLLDETLDPRLRREFLRAVVEKLDSHVPATGIEVEDGSSAGSSLRSATLHTFGSKWARATSELGELARMAFDFPEAVRMYRMALRVWAGSNEQSRLDLVVVLGYVAALAEHEQVCSDALALCRLLGGSPTHPTLLQATHRLAAAKFDLSANEDETATLVARLRA